MNKEINYKNLLRKYMNLIQDCMCETYLTEINSIHNNVEFSEEEIAELIKIEEEIFNENI